MDTERSHVTQRQSLNATPLRNDGDSSRSILRKSLNSTPNLFKPNLRSSNVWERTIYSNKESNRTLMSNKFTETLHTISIAGKERTYGKSCETQILRQAKNLL